MFMNFLTVRIFFSSAERGAPSLDKKSVILCPYLPIRLSMVLSVLAEGDFGIGMLNSSRFLQTSYKSDYIPLYL
jgi:hypothetical protein